MGLPTSPSSPRFDLDGTANGASVNATRIGLSIESEKATPETAVRVLKMEKATRLPLPVIQENLEDVERQVEKKNFDPDRFARENPKAAAWLAAHPQHAALAKDDYNNLSLLETIISKLSGSFIDPSISVAKGLGRGTGGVIKTTGRSLWSMGLPESTENVESISSMIDVAGGPSSGEDSFQEAYADIQKRTGISPGSVSGRELVTKMEPLPYKFFREEGLGPLGKWLTGKGKKIEESALLKDTYHQTTSITQRLMERPVETLLVEGSQQAPNLVASIGGALATKKVGMSPAVGAFATSYLMEKGDILDEGMSYLIELHGSEEKIPPEQIARLNEIATNHASFNAVLDSLAPSSMVARSVIAKAGIKRLLSKQGVKFVAKEAMKDLAREMSTEVVQEESTMRALEKTTGKEIPFEQRLERYITVMAGTLLPVSGSSAVSSRSQISQANKELAVDAERAKQTGQVFTTLGEVATESKTRERLPEKFEEMIGQMTKDGPVENLYVPVEFYQTHWSEQGLDPRAVSAEMGIAKQYDEAITTGGRMEIPTAVYARRIAATEHNAVFAKELSTAPDVMNAREAEEFLKTAGEEIQEKPDAAFEESLSKVREDIRGQMIGLYPQDVVDKYIALEIDSKFATRAKRLGVDPLELYNRRPWTVSRQLPAVLKKLGKVTNLDALIDRVKAGDVQAIQCST